MELDQNEKKIEKMKQDFILALKDISKSIELDSQKTETGHFKLLSNEEEKLISQLRSKGIRKAQDISLKLKAIDRFKDLHFLLENPDPIIVTYYCKFNYPNYAEIFVPILLNIKKKIGLGHVNFEVGMALDEFIRLLNK
ncbi:MAG: hypothetical protein IT221_07925 [Fluviicola sp.]|nr:hypothetical protein [Fluviicola sp.]